MKKLLIILLITANAQNIIAQTNPAITGWLQNTTGITGSRYVSGNSTPILGTDSANIKTVLYSANWVYIRANGIPSYVTGPFLDGNPSIATSQNAIFKVSLNPVQNTGSATYTTGGNIGLFINGVALFDYRDGVAWNTTTNALCGGPGNLPCPGGPTATQSWNRDAIPAERAGFDCSKGHPAMGNYHHHQNPSAFKLDLNVISTVCSLYDADGLYVIDSTQHSPLIGFAYDGFPIYGAYAFENINGTGNITRIKSGYQLRNITTRIVWADGTNVPDGPVVSTAYPLGYFREDYEFIAHPGQTEYLDEHNGRFCVTPEYPAGIYCYFATVDANWNSAYPYVVGPAFFGTKTALKVTSITEPVTVYTASASGTNQATVKNNDLNIFPVPANDLIAIQYVGLALQNINIYLYNMNGKLIDSTVLYQGSTIAYFDTKKLYSGDYIIRIVNGSTTSSKKISVLK